MKWTAWGPALLGAVALIMGTAVMTGLLTYKRAPAEATIARDEKPVHVDVTTAQPTDVEVHIEGFGQVQALRTVVITPEVSGRVLKTHPQLMAGGLIPAGEVLFEIDPRPYEALVADADAQAQRQEIAVARLDAEARHRQADLKDLTRQAELAEKAYGRAKVLHEQGVGSQAAVDQAEQSMVTATNERDRLAREMDLFPIRKAEAESDRASALARRAGAQVDLEHTRVTAPFSGRVKEEQLEVGEVVSAGSPVLTLVDDSILEITVPLNSQDARHWLKFEPRENASDAAWFGALAPVTCTIRWTDGDPGHQWTGTLHRVESYDENTRTVSVVIRIAGDQRRSTDDNFPLVEGMFCSVRIPGREMKGVFRLPAHAVSFEDTVYLAENSRLRTVPVTVTRTEAEFTYVTGLNPGDQVIVTRLVNPLDHSLLEVNDLQEAKSE